MNSLSASRSSTAASERRQYSPRSYSPTDRRTWWNGPALTTVLYGDSGGVGANFQTVDDPAASVWAAPELLVTVQPVGAVTVKACGAFRSGWSKQAQTNRAWSGSNVIQR